MVALFTTPEKSGFRSKLKQQLSPNKAEDQLGQPINPIVSTRIRSAWIVKSKPITAGFDNPAGANVIIFRELNDPGFYQSNLTRYFGYIESLLTKMASSTFACEISNRSNGSL